MLVRHFMVNLGTYLYNNTANALFVRSAYPTRNVPNYVLNSGQNASDPNTPSTKFMEKGDFLRWSNLTIGYTLDSEMANQIGFSSMRVYLNANNLATFTDYTGFDPEVSISKEEQEFHQLEWIIFHTLEREHLLLELT